MYTAYFSGSKSPILSMAAEQAGLEFCDTRSEPVDSQSLLLSIDNDTSSTQYGVLPSDGYKIVSALNEPSQIIANSQRGLAYALMDMSEGKVDPQSSVQYTPSLAIRSYHMWLPFALGQAYGGQGYSAWEMRTDWWWYDRQYWVSFLRELASAHFNMIVFWHTHPHPALIEYEQFPEAAFFNAERQAENIEQFQWILKTAKSYGVDIVMMQYNIHVSPGFAKTHGIGDIKADAGYGGEDTQLVREYNRYCLMQLFKTYPELSGLMICGELNKDAFDFLETTILPALLGAESKPVLHFRLWGQHFPEEVNKLAEKIRGRFVIWHKISKEMISVPRTDIRFSKWLETVKDVPICALAGSGNAPAFRHQGRIYVDPEFVAKQLADLKKKGGSGVGLFTGMDNWFYDKDGLVGNEDSIDRWMKANWLSRQITGRLAWRFEDSSEDFWIEKLCQHYSIDKLCAKGIFGAAVSSSRVLPAINFVVGQYGQDLGFAGMLGMFSQETTADKPGNFRLGGPYAWPLHEWSVEQPDIMQTARSSEQTDELLKMAEEIERKCSQDMGNILEPGENSQAQDLINYIKLNGFCGPLHTNLFKGAVHAYRIPFCNDPEEALHHLEAVIEHLDNALVSAEKIPQFARQIPLIPIKIREDLPTPLRWEKWRPRLAAQRQTYSKVLKHLQSDPKLFEAAKIYWQSHCCYHEAFRWLRENGYHLAKENLQAGCETVNKSILLTRQCQEILPSEAFSKWLGFLETESRRLKPQTMRCVKYNGDMEANEAQIVMWHWDGLVSPCTFDETLLSFFEPETVEFALRKSNDEERRFRLAYDDEGLWLSIECSSDKIPEMPSVFICNRDSETIQQLQLDLSCGKAKLTLAHLRAPHGMAFDEPRVYDVDLTVSLASDGYESFLIKIPFELVGRTAKAGDKWGFNLLWKHRGLLWSPVCGEFNWLDPAQTGTVCFVE